MSNETPMNKPIVLIVDDEPLISIMVEVALEEAGFDVRSVTDAAEAEKAVVELDNRLSALVTDIRLGAGPNGWSVATKTREKLPHLPVVYMTGDSASDWSAFGVPESILVHKPFVGAQIITAVTTLMNADRCDATSQT